MSNIQAYNTAGDYGAPLNSMEQFQDATDTDGIDDVSNNTVASNAALNPAGVAATDGVDQAASGSTCADGAKFDPNTGEYKAFTDPTLSKLFGTIIEMSGVPFSFAQFKSSPSQTAPVAQPDLSAVNPMPQEAGAIQ